jgi:ornithine carbamoyltransferase
VVTPRHFLSLRDRTPAEYRALFARAAELKGRRRAGEQDTTLAGRTLVLLMEKASTRTRLSFAAAVGQLGGHAVELAASTSQLARGEPLADTARVVSGYADAVVFRTSTDARLAEYAAASSIPVINGLSEGGHPVQVLTDLFTVEEALGSVPGRKVAFVGDCAGNMARSFIEAAPIFDFGLRLAAPPGFWPPPELVRAAGGRVTVSEDPAEAVRSVEVVSTDVWTSMGQEAEAEARRAALRGYTVDDALLARAALRAIVLHCLPAHQGEEITEAVMLGPRSRIWDEAENRMHVQKALLEQLILRQDL